VIIVARAGTRSKRPDDHVDRSSLHVCPFVTLAAVQSLMIPKPH
jgi:hypothetical protein